MSQTRKKVLMFCPTFFGYENRIAEAFRDEGFDVALYNERPNNGFVCKTALRLNLKFYKRVVTNYIKKIIEGNDSKSFDFILVVKGEAISEKEITLLKKAYPNAKTVLYLWDSVANVPDGEKKLDLYDRLLTFDPVDAEKYNIKLRPLFFGP